MISKSLMTGTNKIKITSVFIVFITVLACCVPFVHNVYPNIENTELVSLRNRYKQGEVERNEFIRKKREVTFFGYSNKRKLWYAIGKPITMLYFAILLMYSSFYINEEKLSSALKKASVLGTCISFYFIIWAFWYMADFPEILYFIAIGVVAIFSTYCSYEFIKSRNLIFSKIKILTEHIVISGKKHVPEEKRKEYVKDYLRAFNEIID